MSTDHRAKAVAYARAAKAARAAGAATLLATGNVHALLAIHDLLAKRLPSALDGFAATEDPAATEGARCGCGRALPCRHCEEPDATGTDAEDADDDDADLVLALTVLLAEREGGKWAYTAEAVREVYRSTARDVLAMVRDADAGRVRWCHCADAPWDDARCREGECRESWRDAEEAGR